MLKDVLWMGWNIIQKHIYSVKVPILQCISCGILGSQTRLFPHVLYWHPEGLMPHAGQHDVLFDTPFFSGHIVIPSGTVGLEQTFSGMTGKHMEWKLSGTAWAFRSYIALFWYLSALIWLTDAPSLWFLRNSKWAGIHPVQNQWSKQTPRDLHNHTDICWSGIRGKKLALTGPYILKVIIIFACERRVTFIAREIVLHP